MHNYTYLLTLTKPTDSRCFYIGVRTCKGTPDNDVYFGSSTALNKWIREHGSGDIHKTILSRFETRTEAAEHEIFLHERMDVARSSEYWNEAKATSTGFSRHGARHTDAAREKISAFRKENPAAIAHLARLSEAKKGSSHTKDTRTKMAEASRGRTHSMETRAKISDANRGREFSPEHCSRISESRKGRVMSEINRVALLLANKGKVLSLETKTKMSAAKTKYWVEKRAQRNASETDLIRFTASA